MTVALIGQTISNRYKVLAPLGEGAMGAVYLAEDVTLKRKVALKILRKEWAMRPEVHKRLENECRILAKLGSHPHIVTLFDRLVHEENVILVMEFVPGETIAELLNRTRQVSVRPRTGTPIGGPVQSASRLYSPLLRSH
ncbi:MAG: protein kinase [Candidatus Hydrogenedentes bacterium]|nr:protein kinase [Candidatus Hydrogenedentota bacterium]